MGLGGAGCGRETGEAGVICILRAALWLYSISEYNIVKQLSSS